MNEIIITGINVDVVINQSLYSYIKDMCEKNNKFICCHVTKEEFEIMKVQIEENGKLNEKIPKITNDKIGYDRFRYMIINNIYRYPSALELANYDNYDEEGSYSFKYDSGLVFDEKEVNFYRRPAALNYTSYGSLIVYTTEEYNDVLNYYKNYMSDNKSKDELLKYILSTVENLNIDEENKNILSESITLIGKNKINYDEYRRIMNITKEKEKIIKFKD